MSIVSWKLARLVLTYLPFSSSLSEKAMAWTTKSSVPQRLLDRVEGGVEAGVVGHVARHHEARSRADSASGFTRFSSASP